MAITENIFTAAEIQAAVTANPALMTELQTGLQPLGHHAYTGDAHKAFVETERSRIAASERSTIYSAIDKDVREATGLDKLGPEEKTYDYVKRGIAETKKVGTTLEAKVADLEKRISEGGGDAAVRAELDAARTKLKEYDEKVIPGMKADIFNKDVDGEFAKALGGIKFKAEYPKELLQLMIDKVQGDLRKSAKLGDDGKLYFVGADGTTPIMNGVDRADASFIVKDSMKSVIAVAHQAAGGGTGAPAGAPSGIKNKDGAEIIIPAVKNKLELTNFLMQNGLTDGSKEFSQAFDTYVAANPKLPLRPQGE